MHRIMTSAIALVILAGLAVGQIIYVDFRATGGTGSGASWANAKTSLRGALNAAAADLSITEIRVAKGTYKPSASRSSSFEPRSGMDIYGGYPPFGAGSRDPDAHPTTLSGDIGVVGDSSDNCYTVVKVDDASGILLDGFRIKRGRSNGVGTEDTRGAGLYVGDQGAVSVRNCVFEDNYASVSGAAIAVFGNGSVYVNKSVFLDNDAYQQGGAISIEDYDGYLYVNQSRFHGNFGQNYGGAIASRGDMTVYNSAFSGNQTTEAGGAIMVLGNSEAKIVNCTIAGNLAGVKEGGVGTHTPTAFTCYNTIIWFNTAPSQPQIDLPPGGLVLYCNVEDALSAGLTGATNQDVDPDLEDLDGADDVLGTDDDDLHISRTSPCIDQGTNTALPWWLTEDLDEKERYSKRYFPVTNAIIDIGAYEIRPQFVVVPPGTLGLDLDGVPGLPFAPLPAPPGSQLALNLTGEVGAPFVLGAQPLVAGQPLAASPLHEQLYLTPQSIVLAQGTVPSTGIMVILGIPPGLQGLEVVLQGVVLTPQAQNGLFEPTDMFHLVF